MPEDMRRFETRVPPPGTSPSASNRDDARRLAAEINHSVDDLHGRIMRDQDAMRAFANGAMYVVAPVLAARMEALQRAVAEAERIGDVARGHERRIQTLDRELVLAHQQRQQAEAERHNDRVELLDALGILGADDDLDPFEAVRALHAETDRLRGELDSALQERDAARLELNNILKAAITDHADDGEVPR